MSTEIKAELTLSTKNLEAGLIRARKKAEEFKKSLIDSGASSPFSTLVKHSQLAEKALEKTNIRVENLARSFDRADGSGLQSRISESKVLLRIVDDINDEMEKQVRLKAQLAVRDGDGALAQRLSSMRKQTAELKNQVNAVEIKAKKELAYNRMRDKANVMNATYERRAASLAKQRSDAMVRDLNKRIKATATLRKENEKIAKAQKTTTTGLSRSVGVGSLFGAASIYSLIQAASALAQISDQYKLIDAKIKIVTKDQKEFNTAFEELTRISTETGTRMQENAQALNKLKNSIPGESLRGLITMIEGVNKSFVVSGASTQEATGFMIQFAQAMGSGVVNGDELRTMNEANSYLMRKVADSIGTNITGLKAMGEAGTLTTELFRKHLLKVLPEVTKEFKEMPVTLQRAGNELRIVVEQIIAEFDKTSGSSNGIVEAIQELAEYLRENKGDILAFFDQLGKYAIIAGKGVSGLVTYIQSLGAVASGQIDLFDIFDSPDDLKNKLADTEAGLTVIGDLRRQISQIDSDIKAVEGTAFFGELSKGAEDSIEALKKQKKALEDTVKFVKANELSKITVEMEVVAGPDAYEAFYEFAREAKQINKEILEDHKSLAKSIEDIHAEGFTDEQAWDNALEEIERYKVKAEEAAKAGDWTKQRAILQEMAELYKGLAKEVRGPEPDQSQIDNLKERIRLFAKLRSGQDSYAGRYTYDEKIKEAQKNLKALIADQKAGGKLLVSEEESRETRTKGLLEIQDQLKGKQSELTGEINKQVSALKELESFDDKALKAINQIVKDIGITTDETGKSTEDYTGQVRKVGEEWTNIKDPVLDSLRKQAEAIDANQKAVEAYIEAMKEAQGLGVGTIAFGSPTGDGGRAVQNFATGGIVQGSGGTDSVYARVTPGEGVVNPTGMSILTAAGLGDLNSGQNPFSGVTEQVSVDFNFNKRTVGTLAGERRAVTKILDGMSNMKRSLS